jgi:hypothetical protein
VLDQQLTRPGKELSFKGNWISFKPLVGPGTYANIQSFSSSLSKQGRNSVAIWCMFRLSFIMHWIDPDEVASMLAASWIVTFFGGGGVVGGWRPRFPVPQVSHL